MCDVTSLTSKSILLSKTNSNLHFEIGNLEKQRLMSINEMNKFRVVYCRLEHKHSPSLKKRKRIYPRIKMPIDPKI